jgi:hypothetical protein
MSDTAPAARQQRPLHDIDERRHLLAAALSLTVVDAW